MSGSIGTLLIANRGEIAVRIIRTASRMGLRTIAVYSEADQNALHVRLADEAHLIGPAAPRESYLKIDAILTAAKAAGADAIHPGYGFLSENADFADAVSAAGLIFIGPPASAIRAMGSKSNAKSLMERAGVPLVPGYHGEDQALETLAAAADRISYPVLIKASAGGGGKGMKIVQQAAEFADALASARREATGAFGDDKMLVERYLTRPRHIEIQVFADSFGDTVHLFERDCSIQRRHQKVVEEAPAPGMTAARRAEMGEAAIAAARAVGYVGAGTVEFIAEGENFYFMEMNTRLQVEHPVTEAITGVDLVEWQIRIARGERLPMQQADLAISGHAIEVRLYAEDPAREFLPQTGTLHHLSLPTALPGIRVDAGVTEGSTISVYYDPMIAKIIGAGPDRAAAISHLKAGLAATEIVGLSTNRTFLQSIVAHPVFAAAKLDTGFIERYHDVLIPAAPPLDRRLLVLAAFLWLQTEEDQRTATRDPADPHSPWLALRGWRLNRDAYETLNFRFGDLALAVRARFLDKAYALDLPDNTVTNIEGTLCENGEIEACVDGIRVKARGVINDGQITIFSGGSQQTVKIVDPRLPDRDHSLAGGQLLAPMPGNVVRVAVAAGDAVKKGMALVIVEAMKMEHTLLASRDGIVRTVNCAIGQQVREGEELIVLEDES